MISYSYRIFLAIFVVVTLLMATDFVLPIYLVHKAEAMSNLIPPWRGYNGSNDPQNGRGLFQPVYWCALEGSNAGNPSPTAVPNPYGGSDSTGDAILWRRHERATDGMYTPDAAISFRSAFTPQGIDPSSNFHFPVIKNFFPTLPNGSRGTIEGTVLNPNLDSIQDVQRAYHQCQQAWYNLRNLPGAPNPQGIYAVNIKSFVDENGNEYGGGTVATGQGGYSGGWTCGDSSCDPRLAASYTGGYAVVIDNWNSAPVSNYVTTDPHDQLFGHEMGHALFLEDSIAGACCGNHNPNTAFMMYQTSRYSGTPRQVTNLQMSTDEEGLARHTSQLDTGTQIDPIGEFVSSNIVAYQLPTAIEENKSIPSYLDLSSIKAQLDTNTSQVTFTENVFGNITSNATGLHYWVLVNSDNNPNTGVIPSSTTIELPQTNFTGIDFVARLDVNNLSASGMAWVARNGTLVPLDNSTGLYQISLTPGSSNTDYVTVECPIEGECNVANQGGYNVTRYDGISISLSNKFVNLTLDNPFQMQAISEGRDRNGNRVGEEVSSVDMKSPFVLSHPVFAHCFPQSQGVPGGTVVTQVTGLLPNSPIHALLGPQIVTHGQTDSNGNAILNFPIPSNSSLGTHLVTIGVDNTALTADCNIQIIPGPNGGGNVTNIMWINHFDFLPGDPSITTSSNAITSGIGGGLTGLVIESNTTGENAIGGGNKVVHRALEVPPGSIIKEVRVCYESTSNATYISQIRLSQVQDPPSSATVLMDDGTDLVNPGPICVNSTETSVDPSQGPTLLDLRLNFGNTADKIVLRGVGLILAAKS
jgi:hypothetical protein